MKLSWYYYKHLYSQLSPENKAHAIKPKSTGLVGLSIESEEFLALANTFSNLQKDPVFVLRTALKSLPQGHGILGLLVQSCETLGDACSSGYRFQYLSRDGMHSRLEYEEKKVASIVDMNEQDPEKTGVLVEYYQGSLVAIANYLTDSAEPICVKEIYFMHKPRAPLSVYKTLFSCDNIHFSQGVNKITFSRDIMDYPIERADGGAKQVLLKEAKAQLNSLLGRHQLAEKIRRLLLEQQPFSSLSIVECADALNLSGSTLKRRLQSEGTNYKTILDEVLESLAKQYLSEEEKTIQEISLLLGFSDRSAFARSFKRWQGMSPLQYRQQLLFD